MPQTPETKTTATEVRERLKAKGIPVAEPRTANMRAGFEDDPRCGFDSPREFLLRAAQHPSAAKLSESDDARLRFLAGLSTFGDGFLLPPAFHPEGELLRNDTSDPFAGRTTVVPMAQSEVAIPHRVDKDHSTSVSSGVVFTRTPETEEITASTMQVGQLVLRADKLCGLSYATEEILSDSPGTFTALLESGYANELRGTLLNERLNGNGVARFLGINNAPGTITVAKETGQAADTIIGQNLTNMAARCWSYDRAFWIANYDCAPQLLAAVTAAGVPCLTPSQTGETAYDCLGRPLHLTEFCAPLGDAGDIVLAVPSEYVEGVYKPLNRSESIHVRFIHDERCFRFTLRNAGAPWWASPLTPRTGAATLSPFVRLAARA